MPRLRVFLIGFSGSGKSTVGSLLAERLQARFLDTDRMVEREEGRSIAEIFRCEGESRFRRMEKSVIRRVLARSDARQVVALGGGALRDPGLRRAVREAGTVVYLSCAVRELYRRLGSQQDRPLLQARPVSGQTERQARLARISALLKQRLPVYRQADIIYSTTTRSPQEAARELERRIRERSGNH